MLFDVKRSTYSTVLFDLDHTLLDSDASELLAFDHAMQLSGVEEPGQHLELYLNINRALWAAVERQELTPNNVRTARFEQLVVAASLDADPAALADAFAAGLGSFGELYSGARAMLDTLAGTATLALVTNGLSEVQRARIERLGLANYFDVVVISAEVGASKPSPAIFDVTFALLGSPPKPSVLMVGDSLTSDIRGGINYGIATCWYNPRGQIAHESDHIDHEVDALHQIPAVVIGQG